eukprot:NODE_10_length_47437_cov_0.363429.p27 type:complete len:133 gc:universal NODE_10_length_47437_cov_0.363429:26398-26796(+)
MRLKTQFVFMQTLKILIAKGDHLRPLAPLILVSCSEGRSCQLGFLNSVVKLINTSLIFKPAFSSLAIAVEHVAHVLSISLFIDILLAFIAFLQCALFRNSEYLSISKTDARVVYWVQDCFRVHAHCFHLHIR